MTVPSRVPSRAMPSVISRVWPTAWECQAVRAPGVKWTQPQAIRDGSGLRTWMASMYTSPVNHSAGAFLVGCFGSMSSCLSPYGRLGCRRKPAWRRSWPTWPGPAGVERQVGDRLDQLGLGDAVLPGQAQVVGELLGVPARGQRGDSDQAAVPRRQLRARSQTWPNSVSSVKLTRRGGEVAEHFRRAGRLFLWAGVGMVGHVCPSLIQEGVPDQCADDGRGQGNRGGDQQADPQAVQERCPAGQQRPEHRDRQRAADLPAGIEDAARYPGLAGGNARAAAAPSPAA